MLATKKTVLERGILRCHGNDLLMRSDKQSSSVTLTTTGSCSLLLTHWTIIISVAAEEGERTYSRPLRSTGT
jgi:hypothetical protein